MRFGVLSRVALTIVRHVYRPDVIHCHDWQAALLPIYARTEFGLDPTYMGIPVVFTIHNLGFQGLFPPETLSALGLDPKLFTPDCLEFYGRLNLLKGAILTSEAITTVSPTYAREIQTEELGFKLEGVLKMRTEAVSGILNGADYTQWDPATDRHLAARYTPDNLEGKRADKADLLAAFNLPADRIDRPLLGMVTRLTPQKGLDLVEEAAPALLAEDDVTLVILGAGDPATEASLRQLQDANPRQVAVRIEYNDKLAHKIEAGADLFLMPSRYEPCGLNQIYSLHYGTVPVVRATGGLEDTVDEATGFKFREYTAAAFLKAIRAGLAAWSDPDRWTAMMRAGMAKDFSWNASAAQYAALYRKLVV